MKSKRTSHPRRRTPRTTPNAQAVPAAPTPTTPPPAPVAPPPKRRLPGVVHGQDATGYLRGSLRSFRAAYAPAIEAISVLIEVENYNFIRLEADHTHTRAAIGTGREALRECDRLAGHYDTTHAAFPSGPQVQSFVGSATSFEDEELRFRFLPQRDLIELSARFSDNGKAYIAWAYLTRVEAVALLHDLDRALYDFERNERLGVGT